MQLDFTVRIKVAEGPDAEKTRTNMVQLYKSFMSETTEEERQNGLELVLNILEAVGPKKAYTTETFATLTR